MALTTLDRVPITARAFDPATGKQLTLTAPSWTSATPTVLTIEDPTLAPNGSSAMAWLVGKSPGESVVTFAGRGHPPGAAAPADHAARNDRGGIWRRHPRGHGHGGDSTAAGARGHGPGA